MRPSAGNTTQRPAQRQPTQPNVKLEGGRQLPPVQPTSVRATTGNTQSTSQQSLNTNKQPINRQTQPASVNPNAARPAVNTRQLSVTPGQAAPRPQFSPQQGQQRVTQQQTLQPAASPSLQPGRPQPPTSQAATAAARQQPARPAVNRQPLQHIVIDDDADDDAVNASPPRIGPSLSERMSQQTRQQPYIKREVSNSSQNSQRSGYSTITAARGLNLSQQSEPPRSPSPISLGINVTVPESEEHLRAQAQNLRDEALEDEQRWQKTTTDVFDKQDHARKHRLTFVRVNQTKRDCTLQTHKQIVDLVPLFVECYTESQADFVRRNFQVMDRLSNIASSIVSEEQAREQADAENSSLPFAESFAAMDKQLESAAIRDEEESKEESKEEMAQA